MNFIDLNVSHYVRADATGNNDGTDWTNAWTEFPQNKDFIRGHIYYIADGDYPFYHFSAQQDGEKYIYIRKATESDHGTDTGWNSSYGDGQAKFNDRWEMSKSYYIFDGKTGGGPGSRETERGIQVNADDTPFVEGEHMRLVAMHGYPAWNREMPSNIEFRRIDFRHQGIDRIGSHRIINNHADVADPVNDGYRNISIRYCSLYNASTMLISSVYGSGWVAEYNYFARNNSTPEIHGAAWQDHGSNNMVVRYNIFEDTQGTSVIDLKRNLGHSNDNWHIYGNVFFSTNGSDIELGMGIVSDNGSASGTETTSRIYVYNNTIYNLDGHRSGVEFWVPDDGTRYAYNNLFIRNRCKVYFNEVNYDYNYYYDNITLQFDLAEHDQVSDSDPCTDFLNYDFRLSGATDAGITLPELYNKDMYGNIRG
ncbi:MAG: hypothetical protein SVM80_13560, partial [Halobacteriota archaeon]|nr:hypothetical protein [Halobacteriota archaeon]